MVICETSEQARQIAACFDEVQAEINTTSSTQSKLKYGLILHDSEDKETRKEIVKNFKKNMTVDILIVFNMLLTGFDAPRLKRLYFGRKLRDHNLLQAITRVNRPYKDNRYGYVIDFADIKKNFAETNEAYLQELNRFNDPDETGIDNIPDTFSQVIEDQEALISQMREVRQVLFNYTTDNPEEFSSEISTIDDKKELLELKKVLESARDCFNIVRTFGDDDLKETFAHLQIEELPAMLSEVQHHINLINQKEAFDQDDSTKMMVNDAMKDIQFDFHVVDTEEMKIISDGQDLQEKWSRVISAFTDNVDPEDPEYITLREAFMLRFKEHGFVIDSLAQFDDQSKALDGILTKLQELQKKNNVLLKKYNGDAKFARVHKRIREENEQRKIARKKPIVSNYDESIMTTLLFIKKDIDQQVYDRNDILKKDAYFERTVMTEIKKGLDAQNLENNRDDRLFIQMRLTKQYMNQYRETYPVY